MFLLKTVTVLSLAYFESIVDILLTLGNSLYIWCHFLLVRIFVCLETVYIFESFLKIKAVKCSISKWFPQKSIE